MITNWKRQAIKNMAETFTGKADRVRAADEARVKDLHAKIGQLTVERNFERLWRSLKYECIICMLLKPGARCGKVSSTG